MDTIATGHLIAARRKALGLSQAELAEQIHVTDKAVSRWETGRGMPAVDSLEPLAEALGLSVSELLSGRELAAEELPKESGKQIVAAMRKNAAMVWRGALAAIVALLLMVSLPLLCHYIVTVPENDAAALAQAAKKYLGHPGRLSGFQDDFNYEELSIAMTRQRADYLAALCGDGAGHWCICIYDRDGVFPNRWQANGGTRGMESGEIGSWNFGAPQGTAVIAFGGGDLPEEAAWYTFQNSGVTYTCPIENRQVLDLFLLPDTVDIVSHQFRLLDADLRPLDGHIVGEARPVS